ncbi:MAG: hypothetical protein D6733_00060 [Methanobacteriota archaeon]|nr:MAG: hypothetical protein D6733_00060 [Euryarchaeota archaeon]
MAYEHLDAFVKELEGEDLLGKERDKILDALRIIYIGQEKEGTIGIPHGDVDTIFENEVARLLDMGMIYTVEHTGVWDFGYRCTEKGNLVGHDIMRKVIDETGEELRRFLDRIPPKLLTYWFRYAFERTDTGHYSSRVPMHSFKYIVTKVLESADILNLAERVRKGLISLDVAVKTFDGHITILAPEFGEFVEQYLVDIGEGVNNYGLYQTLIDFADRRGFSTRFELLERIERHGWTEEQLMELVNEMAELGITSRYLAEPITEESLEEEDEEEDEEIRKLREEIIGERTISFVEDRPFRVYDRDGYEAYLKEVFLEPFKEELLASS